MKMTILQLNIIVQSNSIPGQGNISVPGKWKGYSEKLNAWELITNFLDAVLNKFEQEKQTPALNLTRPSARSGLHDRQAIKSKYNLYQIRN